eukprot:707557-Alexandrium_andersonii.AAC.1
MAACWGMRSGPSARAGPPRRQVAKRATAATARSTACQPPQDRPPGPSSRLRRPAQLQCSGGPSGTTAKG